MCIIEDKKTNMSSGNRNKEALYDQLRSVTNSSAVNKASILVDATKYIEELKGRVEKLNQDITSLESSSQEDTNVPAVKVETLETGFLISVFAEKNCPGLLVSILEAFEELGLEVLDARVSCSDNFHLEAVSESEGQSESMNAQVVRQAVVQAIRTWSKKNGQD